MIRRLNIVVAVSNLLVLVFLNISIDAQTINITGSVVDSATSAAISGASVNLAEYPSVFTTTNASGTFTLSANATGAAVPPPPSSLSDHYSLRGNCLTITTTTLRSNYR